MLINIVTYCLNNFTGLFNSFTSLFYSIQQSWGKQHFVVSSFMVLVLPSWCPFPWLSLVPCILDWLHCMLLKLQFHCMDPEHVLTSAFHFTVSQGGCSLQTRLLLGRAFYFPRVCARWSREKTNPTCSRDCNKRKTCSPFRNGYEVPWGS